MVLAREEGMQEAAATPTTPISMSTAALAITAAANTKRQTANHQLVRHASLPRRKGGGGGGGGGGGSDVDVVNVNERNTSTFCTGERRKRKPRPLDLKQLPLTMTPIELVGTGEAGGSGGGLSNSLSTESLRQACGMYEHDDGGDELSDDDFIEVQNTPTGFPKQQLPQHQHNQYASSSTSSSGAATAAARALHSFVSHTRKQRRNSDENPLAADDDEEEERRQEMDAENDPLSVLNELDAILESHGGGGDGSLQLLSLSTDEASSNADDEPKVEDCLLDLDNYLEELDARSDIMESDSGRVSPSLLQQHHRVARTLPLERKMSLALERSATLDTGAMQRGHCLRRTIGAAPTPTAATATAAIENLPSAEAVVSAIHLAPTSESQQLWRRQSMRHTDMYLMPECHSPSATSPTTTASPVASDNSPMGPSQAPNHNTSHNQSHASPHNNSTEMLTQEDIFQNLLQQHGLQQGVAGAPDEERPRQFGRRASGHPRVLSLRCDLEASNHGGCTIIGHDQRPRSAPASGRGVAHQQAHHTIITQSASDVSSARSSHNASPISLALSSTDASSSSTAVSSAVVGGHPSSGGGPDQPPHTAMSTAGQLEAAAVANATTTTPSSAAAAAAAAAINSTAGMNARWPHEYSRTLALLCCTLGLFNICRFAVLTVHYGGNFLLQFLLLSIVFGIPLFWLQMCLGAKIRAGPVCMWKISPICRGIGIALVLVQSLMAIYSTAAIAWLLVYLRDSFPSAADGSSSSNATTITPLYHWHSSFNRGRASSSFNDSAINITAYAADYFNFVVLQRLQFARHRDGSEIHFHVNDRLAFNMAIIWAVVFLVLCKGLRSLGKLVFPLTLLPLLTLTVITGKFLSIVNLSKLQNLIAATNFDDFLINSKTWTAAAQETFLTWGLLGAAVVAMSSRHCEKGNNAARSTNKTALRHDALLVVVLTLMGLTLAALLGLCCIQVLAQHEYNYVPGSYEHPDSYVAIHSLKSSALNTPVLFYPKLVPHYSSFIGETYRLPSFLVREESGYQALRFVSELFPAVGYLMANSFSWVWLMLTFATLFVFGLAQLCAMWKPISSALGNSTSSVLLSCVTGLLLSIPFATEMGISLLHYMDLLLGGSWFVPLLWTAQIFGVFLIRGRPYNGDDLVNDLRMSASLSAFLALSWNVLLPIGLITLMVVEYKVSASNQFYYWRGKSYFSYWSRKVGGLTQVCLLLLVPVTALVQIYRYMTSGPPDILDRIQLLYRPNGYRSSTRRGNGRGTSGGGGGGNLAGRRHTAADLEPNLTLAHEDAPPKYTPPPSYTTATGARLAKIFRQSIRRSVRRLLGDARTRPILALDTELNQPPDYSTTERSSVNVTISESLEITDTVDHATTNATTTPTTTNPSASTPISTITPYTQRSHTLGSSGSGRGDGIGGNKDCWPHDFNVYQKNTRRPASAPRSLEDNRPQHQHQRPYTAADVVTVLGCTASSSSMRVRRGESSDIIPLSRHIAAADVPPTPQPPDSPNRNSFRSIENLILNAEPLGRSASVAAEVAAIACDSNSSSRHRERNGGTNASSVI